MTALGEPRPRTTPPEAPLAMPVQRLDPPRLAGLWRALLRMPLRRAGG